MFGNLRANQPEITRPTCKELKMRTKVRCPAARDFQRGTKIRVAKIIDKILRGDLKNNSQRF